MSRSNPSNLIKLLVRGRSVSKRSVPSCLALLPPGAFHLDLPSTSTTRAMNPDEDLQFDFPPFLCLYKSGRVERLIGTERVPASVDPETGVASKDVVIDAGTGIAARLYIPGASSAEDRHGAKLPILVYFHGGGFAAESAFSPTYHKFLNTLVAGANLVAVSVEYRLAPEHPLPAAYDDALAALKWVSAHARGGDAATEAWLRDRGDFRRFFLAGDSAGGNIAHNLLLRTCAEAPKGEVEVSRLALIHPYFWGKEPLGREPRDQGFRAGMEESWGFVCAGSMGIEDVAVDPLGDGVAAAAMRGLPCARVLVCVTEKDLFRERGRAYYERLKASGWGGEAEFFESEDEQHVFFLSKPKGEKQCVEILRRLADFFNRT